MWDKKEFIHFALTSDDVNNIAFSLMLKEGIRIYSESLLVLMNTLAELAHSFKAIPLLSLTHGQAATPSTLGKELAVFWLRFQEVQQQLKSI